MKNVFGLINFDLRRIICPKGWIHEISGSASMNFLTKVLQFNSEIAMYNQGMSWNARRIL